MRLRAGDPAPRHTLDRPAHVVGNTELAVPYRTSVQKTAPPPAIPSTRCTGKWRYPATTPASIIAPPVTPSTSMLCPAKRTHAGGRPESECGTVASYKRHQRRGETPDALPFRNQCPAPRVRRKRKEMAG
jgi:hypothetical protein